MKLEVKVSSGGYFSFWLMHLKKALEKTLNNR